LTPQSLERPFRGQLVLARAGKDDKLDIYTINADGTDLTNLTNDPADDHSPDWSPDGTRIAFVSYQDGIYNIYMMHADGSNLVQVTHDGESSSWSWSPDGDTIAFASKQGGESNIYTMQADSGTVTRITHDGGGSPLWSPDGHYISYMTSNKNVRFVMLVEPLDSSTTTLMTTTKQVQQRLWASDGSMLAITTEYMTTIVRRDASLVGVIGNFVMQEWFPDGAHLLGKSSDGLAIVTPDGHEREVLGIQASDVALSPDGTRIAVRLHRLGTDPLFIVQADGSNLQQLTSDLGGSYPTWSPDGQHIVFGQPLSIEGPAYIMIIHADGTGEKVLTTGQQPDWQPTLPPPEN
jgi:TolB protein